MSHAFAQQRALPVTLSACPARAALWTLLMITPLLVGLPLIGVVLHPDLSLSTYTEFPPLTRYVVPAPFSWTVFVLMGLVLAGVVGPFLVRWVRSSVIVSPEGRATRRFPRWGYLGLLAGAAAWIVAWNRFAWFSDWQMHTFTPLWIGYIVTVNALAFQRSGRCMMTHRTRFFVLLFPFSAAFWWFFEYLNRFVQNWYYIGMVELGSMEYFWFATLPFATVLPAVLGTQEWLRTFPVFQRGFTDIAPIPSASGHRFSILLLLLSCCGLVGIGIWPDLLFPLLWVAPLFLIVSLQTVMKQRTILHRMAVGDWNRLAAVAVAALLCGFFWEMWNSQSLAKWMYAVPYVNGLKLFEMPVLGYAGYLPFGLECLVIGDLLHGLVYREWSDKG